MSRIPLFIGPCVLESQDLAEKVCETLLEDLKEVQDKVDLHFKGSFDKANRSSIDSYRGPGIDEGLKILESVNKKYGLKTITDFHSADQAKPVASVVDVLQVPAFLCRQTDIVVEGANACKEKGRKLKIKKGQFLSPWDAKNIVDKATEILNADDVYLTERGTSFGYNTLVVDMTGYEVMKSFGVKVIHDATHCVQRPGGLGKSSGGMREAIYPLAKAAIAAGADGIFLEAHPDPQNAKSDAATQLPLNDVRRVITNLIKLKEFVGDL